MYGVKTAMLAPSIPCSRFSLPVTAAIAPYHRSSATLWSKRIGKAASEMVTCTSGVRQGCEAKFSVTQERQAKLPMICPHVQYSI